MQNDYYDSEDKADDAKEPGPTTMLSKSVLMGKEVKPGDKITLTVKGVHDDELAVTYSQSEPASDEAQSQDAMMDDSSEGKPEYLYA